MIAGIHFQNCWFLTAKVLVLFYRLHQSLLDDLDTIEYYQQPGKAHHLSEITAKQRELYEVMDVNVPE